jgi:hypothetical protein
MKRREPKSRSAVPLAKQFVSILQKEYSRWRSTLRWLDGKTIQCRILREASAELVFEGHEVKAVGRWVSSHPDLAFTLSRTTLMSLIEGLETPTEAVFNGALRVAGRSEDLTRAHNLFTDIMERLSTSERFEVLYSEFKQFRVKPLKTAVSLEVNGYHPRSGRAIMTHHKNRAANNGRVGRASTIR